LVLEKKKQAKKITKKKSVLPLLIILIFKIFVLQKWEKNEEECVKKIIIGCAFWNLSVIYFFLFQEGKKSEGMGAIDAKDKNLIFIFWF